jgi:Pentatricopeptide repeat domain
MWGMLAGRMWHVLIIAIVLALTVLNTAAFIPSLCNQRSVITYCYSTPDAIATTSNPLRLVEQYQNDILRIVNASALEQLPSRPKRTTSAAAWNDGLDQAERMLQRLRQRQDETLVEMVNERTYQIVMQAFLYHRGSLRWNVAGSGTTNVATVLERLLDNLLTLPDMSFGQVSMETFDLVLQSYAICATARTSQKYASPPRNQEAAIKSNYVSHANKAEQLYRKMIATFGGPTGTSAATAAAPDSRVPLRSIVHVIHAYAWEQANLQAASTGAYSAARYLDEVEALADPQVHYQLLMTSYFWVLEAWSKSSSPGSADRAQEILYKMKALEARVNQGDDSDPTLTECRPPWHGLDAEAYSNAILAWSKSPEAHGADRAWSILQELCSRFRAGNLPAGSEPPLIAFNAVISAYGRRGNSTRAEQVLWMMEELRLDCSHLVPGVVSYNSILHGHLRNPDKQLGLKKALELVAFMEDHGGADQPAIRPDSFTYGTLLKFYLQSGRPGSAAKQAERALLKTAQLWDSGDRSMDPNNRLFNMVINAHAKSGHASSAGHALALLNRMKRSDLYPPDIITYTSVMECCSKSLDRDMRAHVTALLEEVQQLYSDTKDAALMPNLRTYTVAIQNHENVAEARSLLNQLLSQYELTLDERLKPNAYPYNYVINCAANTVGTDSEKQAAFQIAAETFQSVRGSKILSPDSYTYAFWIKCCNNLLRSEKEGDLRSKCISFAFEECKQRGLVTNEVLQRLQANSQSLVTKLLPMATDNKQTMTSRRIVQVEDVPRAWCREANREPATVDGPI